MKRHLAQVNIGKFRKPPADPVNADFMNALDRVNAIAEASPGFVWRLKDDTNNATSIRVFDDPDMAINMSAWESVEDLAAFTFRQPFPPPSGAAVKPVLEACS